MKAHREVRHLEWRVRLFGAGAILAVVGMATEVGWLVNVAIGVLVAGFLLRFLPDRAVRHEDTAEDQNLDGGPEPPPR